MSTILRALKKLEHDKASRKPGPDDMDLEFLESTPPAPRRSALKGILLVGLLVACGSAATYLYMSSAEKAPVPPLPAVPQVRQAVFKPATSALPTVPSQANRSSATAPQTVPSPSAQALQKPAPALRSGQQQPTAKPHPPQASKAPRTSAPPSYAPSLTVNGIALSDGEKRKAIVNGMTVAVGSTIEGARVEDIRGNRVRFSYGGKTFEISVGNTGP